MTETSLPGVVLVEQDVHHDERGFFLETFRKADYDRFGQFVQDNISHSSRGVVRGLHYQLRHPQAKLVSCLDGHVFDVVVDVRRGSPTFGQHVVIELSGVISGQQLFVPEGFAHGFMARSDHAVVQYKCSDYYDPKWSRGIKWNDPALGIDWKIPRWMKVMLSEKDARNPRLKDAELPRWKR